MAALSALNLNTYIYFSSCCNDTKSKESIFGGQLINDISYCDGIVKFHEQLLLICIICKEKPYILFILEAILLIYKVNICYLLYVAILVSFLCHVSLNLS
jgi:hypothetical protein